jgi:hypothetical protein
MQVNRRDIFDRVAMLVSFSSLPDRATSAGVREGWSNWLPSFFRSLDVTNSASVTVCSTLTPSSFSAPSENDKPENDASSAAARNTDIVLWTGSEKGELDGVAVTLFLTSKAFWNDDSGSTDTISWQSTRVSEREDTDVVRIAGGTDEIFLHGERSLPLSQKARLKPNTPPNSMAVSLPRSTGSP